MGEASFLQTVFLVASKHSALVRQTSPSPFKQESEMLIEWPDYLREFMLDLDTHLGRTPPVCLFGLLIYNLSDICTDHKRSESSTCNASVCRSADTGCPLDKTRLVCLLLIAIGYCFGLFVLSSLKSLLKLT